MTTISKWIAIVSLAVLVPGTYVAATHASVHVSYNVVPSSLHSGSWLHSATSPAPTPNGPSWNGDDVSDRVAGSLEGNLENNILSDIEGNVHGKLGQLASYVNDIFSTVFDTSDMFELQLGESASGGVGKLKFETDGVGSGQFTGGVLSFSLIVSSESLLNGTFFFKPQAETASAVLTPNRGDSNAFTLWGLNWMHGGEPQDAAEQPDWLTFLDGLDVGVTEQVDRPPITLGIALFAVDPPDLSNPEPATVVIWGLLAAIGMAARRGTRS